MNFYEFDEDFEFSKDKDLSFTFNNSELVCNRNPSVKYVVKSDNKLQKMFQGFIEYVYYFMCCGKMNIDETIVTYKL